MGRRKFPRYKIALPVEFVDFDVVSTTVDISMSGIAICNCDSDCNAFYGMPLRIAIDLPVVGRVVLLGTITRISKDVVAIELERRRSTLDVQCATSLKYYIKFLNVFKKLEKLHEQFFYESLKHATFLGDESSFLPEVQHPSV